MLHFNNTSKTLWIRVDAILDEFDNAAETISVVAAGGTGNVTTDAISETGPSHTLYANIYSLGTIESTPGPQVYVFQEGSVIAEWSDLTNFDRGHIDILVKVKESGAEIDSGNITVFARQYGDLFDNFAIDLTDGGRNAVPLATAADLNNTTGEYYLIYDAKTQAMTTENQIVTGQTSGATAEVITITDWNGDTADTGMLTLVGIKGTFQDNEIVEGATEGSLTIKGTVGDTFGTWDAESVSPIDGDISKVLLGGTSGAKRLLRSLSDDGTTGKYIAQVDSTQTGSDKTDQYDTYDDDEAITAVTGNMNVTSSADSTTITSGFGDITIAFVNGTCTTGGTAGTFIEGERITWSGGEGILLEDDSSVLTIGNCTDTGCNGDLVTGDLSSASATPSQDLQSAYYTGKAFTQASEFEYSVIIECGSIYEAGRTLANVYEYLKFVTREDSTFSMYTVVSAVITILDGEEYIIAYTGYTPVKASPFGTFAGGTYFGAQSVWVEGMHSDDTQSFQLIDRLGNTKTPPNFQNFVVSQVVSGDTVGVFLATGTTINKAQFTSGAGNTSGAGTFTILEDIPSDTPGYDTGGYIRVVDDSDSSVNREVRYQYDSWSGKVFDLTSTLDRTYINGTDTAYVGYIDQAATGTSVTIEVIYADTSRSVLTRVRRYNGAGSSIIPFQTTGTFSSTGYSAAAIRTSDDIVE